MCLPMLTTLTGRRHTVSRNDGILHTLIYAIDGELHTSANDVRMMFHWCNPKAIILLADLLTPWVFLSSPSLLLA